MTNHAHLLVTPEDKLGVSRMMQSLGRSYVRYINMRYGRSGTLWEGRFRSTLVDSDGYFLTVSRYIELNPVRASMVDHASYYPWSSYQANALGKQIALLTPHPLYQQLVQNAKDRQAAYRYLFHGRMAERTLEEIREATNKGWALGDQKFKTQIQPLCNHRVQSMGWGGDRKSKSCRE